MAIDEPDREALAELWHEILSFSNRAHELFGPHTSRLLDRHEDDRIPHPGFVGLRYRCGGLLFLGMNPGNGGDGRNTSELPHNRLLRQLKDSGRGRRLGAFEELMEYDTHWYPQIRIMRTLVTPILAEAGFGFESIAYMNVLKWRTSSSSGLKPLFEISLRSHTLAQLATLDPGVIAVLGAGVADCLAKFPVFHSAYGDRCVTIPRTRGDFRVDEQGREGMSQVLERLRDKCRA